MDAGRMVNSFICLATWIVLSKKHECVCRSAIDPCCHAPQPSEHVSASVTRENACVRACQRLIRSLRKQNHAMASRASFNSANTEDDFGSPPLSCADVLIRLGSHSSPVDVAADAICSVDTLIKPHFSMAGCAPTGLARNIDCHAHCAVSI